MGGGDLLMSTVERERSHVVRQAIEGVLSQREGSERLGIGVRQFKRLVRSFRRGGDAGLVSRQRLGCAFQRLVHSHQPDLPAAIEQGEAGSGYGDGGG